MGILTTLVGRLSPHDADCLLDGARGFELPHEARSMVLSLLSEAFAKVESEYVYVETLEVPAEDMWVVRALGKSMVDEHPRDGSLTLWSAEVRPVPGPEVRTVPEKGPRPYQFPEDGCP